MKGLWHLVDSWFLSFALLLSYWEIAEAAQLGRQFSDPLPPCAFMACVFFGPVDALRHLRRWLAKR